MVRQKSSDKLDLMLGIWLIRALVVSVGQNFVLFWCKNLALPPFIYGLKKSRGEGRKHTELSVSH